MMEREEKNRLILAELARLYPDAKTRAALCQSVSAARRRGSLRSVYGCESQHGYARALRGLSRRSGFGQGRTGRDRTVYQDLRPVPQQGQKPCADGAGAGRPLRRRSARGSRRSGIPAGRGTQDGERRHELRVRRGRHRRRYACFPRHQSAGAGGRARMCSRPSISSCRPFPKISGAARTTG